MPGDRARHCSNTFLGLQNLLAKGEQPACPTCQEMLQQRGFSAAVLKARLQKRDRSPESPFAQLVHERRMAMESSGEALADTDPMAILKLFPELQEVPEENPKLFPV